MKKYISILIFTLFLFLIKTPITHAAVIFQDSFQGGINNSDWIVENHDEFGNNFTVSPFGIHDAGIGGKFTSIVTTTSAYTIDNEMKVDVRINTNPSSFNLFCRYTDLAFASNFGAQFYPDGTGNTIDTFNFSDHISYNWDNSPGAHHFDVICNGSNLKVIEDGNFLYNDPTHVYAVDNSSSKAELSFGGFGGIPRDSEFANFQLCDINGCGPVDIDLNVPLLQQNNPIWGNHIYDSANLWSPLHPTMSDWGCAVSSAAMVLQYYGVTKLPDGTTHVNPDTLNTWLKSQPDGYVGDGLVNWLAISRLSKVAKSANPITFTHDALEYSRVNGYNTNALLTDLQHQIPGILEEPGHFVVAKGTQGSTFTIHDPFYIAKTTLNSYGNSFLSLGTYTPSNTDLSYILLTGPQGIHFSAFTSTGSAVGEEYLQQPLTSDNISGLAGGQPIDTFYLQQPPTGSYTIQVTTPDNQPQVINQYFYDKNGDVNIIPEIIASQSSALPISFNADNNQQTMLTIVITPDMLLSDIQNLIHLNLLSNPPATPLSEMLKKLQKNNLFAKRAKLTAADLLLSLFHGRGVTDTAYTILHSDLQYLLNHL